MPQFPRERWRELSPYLDQALDIEPAARAAWIAALRDTDPVLARDLVALLSEHEAADQAGFLDGMALDAALCAPQQTLGIYENGAMRQLTDWIDVAAFAG